MQVNKVNNSQNFGMKFTESFKQIVNEKAHGIIFQYSKNSKEYKEFSAIIKTLKKTQKGDTLDAYKSVLSQTVAVFQTSQSTHTQNCARIENDKNLFKNILDFVLQK